MNLMYPYTSTPDPEQAKELQLNILREVDRCHRVPGGDLGTCMDVLMKNLKERVKLVYYKYFVPRSPPGYSSYVWSALFLYTWHSAFVSRSLGGGCDLQYVTAILRGSDACTELHTLSG